MTMGNLIDKLDAIAMYDGPWKPLKDEVPLLKERVAELRGREERLDNMLIVALVGGSGVGKSTLLNAIAGDQIAKTSEFRPCTNVPTVYHPPGSTVDLGEWTGVSRSALENLIIIDTPDSDSIVGENREKVVQVLSKCDLIAICASPEKYLDEATWSLLRPLCDERTFVCIETKAESEKSKAQEGEPRSVREDWNKRLSDQGFKVDDYFRVSALHTLERKITGATSEDEYDFARFETFLQEELDKERIARVKRSNALGLLNKAIDTLRDRVCVKKDELLALQKKLEQCEGEICASSMDAIRDRLFSDPHLWNFAMARETALRSKGIILTLFRVLQSLSDLPGRFARLFSWGGREGVGRKAASVLADKEPFSHDILAAAHEIKSVYDLKHSEMSSAFAKAGFETARIKPSFEDFAQSLNSALEKLLRGPARNRLIASSRKLTSWLVTILLDAPVLAFIVFAGYKTVQNYFTLPSLPGVFFLHSMAVLAIILCSELFLVSVTVRALAWSARRRTLKDFRSEFGSGQKALSNHLAALEDTIEVLTSLDALSVPK